MSTTPATRPDRRHGIAGKLNAEWDVIGATPLPPRWVTRHRDLAPHATPNAIVTWLTTRARCQDADPVLHALLTLHADGDHLAGRTILQAMLGKALRLEPTARHAQDPDPTTAALTAMWASITTYPLRRTTSVAANLALDALHILKHSHHPSPPTITLSDPFHHATDPRSQDPEPDQTSPTHTVIHLLRTARDTHTLTPHDVALLAHLHIAGLSAADLGAQMGLTAPTIRKRASRAIARLAAAIAAQPEAFAA